MLSTQRAQLFNVACLLILPTTLLRLIWEEAAVAGLLERRRTGGSRPAPGVEQEALAAALRRAPLLRRIVTKGLLMF